MDSGKSEAYPGSFEAVACRAAGCASNGEYYDEEAVFDW